MANTNQVIDVVNFNADASCLSNERWIKALEGGVDSDFNRWLSLYVDNAKKVVIGFPGATVADIATFNPACLDTINAHPDVFEVILRPFAHDIGLLRTPAGFRLNLDLGLQTIRNEFTAIQPYYLPPEFMCNSSHISELVSRGVRGVFLYPARFDDAIAARIPIGPFMLKGLLGKEILTLPIDHASSEAYLESIHTYSADSWNQQLQRTEIRSMFAWRDGESTFLLPDTIDREATWLRNESGGIERCFISDMDFSDSVTDKEERKLEGAGIYTYPIHSFAAWVQEMKMYWYISKVEKIEEELPQLDDFQRYVWLQLINSDILSAVEKRPPVIEIKMDPNDNQLESYTIERLPKEYAGEAFVHLLTHVDDDAVIAHYRQSDEPHMKLLRARVAYLENLSSPSDGP